MNEPMITNRRKDEEEVRRFACPAVDRAVPRKAAEAMGTFHRLSPAPRVAASLFQGFGRSRHASKPSC